MYGGKQLISQFLSELQPASLFSLPNQPKSTNKYQQPCRRDPDTTARATTTIPLVERIRRLVRAITVSFSFVLLDLVVRAVMFLAPKGMNCRIFSLSLLTPEAQIFNCCVPGEGHRQLFSAAAIHSHGACPLKFASADLSSHASSVHHRPSCFWLLDPL